MTKKRKSKGFNTQMQTYAKRNQLLSSLGFSSYSEYLASEVWSAIRVRVLLMAEYKCKICGRPATTVHHIGYGKDALIGHKLTGIVALCSGCHYKIEFSPDGKKRTLCDAHSAYGKMWRISPLRKRKKSPKKRQQGQRSHLDPSLDQQFDRRFARDPD